MEPRKKSLLIVKNVDSIDESVLEVANVIAAFKCKRCTFVTFNKTSLLDHSADCLRRQNAEIAKAITEKVMFVCSQCSSEYPSPEECRRHMIEDHHFQTIKPNPVDITKPSPRSLLKCNQPKRTRKSTADDPPATSSAIKEFWSTPKTKKEAQVVLRSGKIVKCAFMHCFYKFHTTEAMNMHYSCHVEPEQVENEKFKKSTQKTPTILYSCFNCPKTFTNWPSCSLHLWREHKISLDLLICPLCRSLRTYGVAKMMEHLARHWRKMNVIDSNPDETNSSQEDVEKPKYPKWYNKVKCEICEKLFSDCKSLKKHVQAVHKKIKPFICNVCGHSAARKHMMQLHMRQHTGERPYACPSCDYSTGDHNTLRKHIMRHTGERPYKCSLCDYASIQSVALKNHMKSAHVKIDESY